MMSVYLVTAIVGVGLVLLSLFGDGGESDVELDGLWAGVFTTRGLTFFLAAFGATGLLLTWQGSGPWLTALLAGGTGLLAMGIVVATMRALRRSDLTADPIGDHDLSGVLGRVILPLTPGQRGQIACLVRGHEVYLTAELAEAETASLAPGQTIVVVHAHDGIAQVVPAPLPDLPPLT